MARAGNRNQGNTDHGKTPTSAGVPPVMRMSSA